MTQHTLDSSRLVFFPALTRRNHRITSDETDEYNCIAWAAEDNTRWWWPQPDAYWPPNVLRDDADLQSFIEAFGTLGYEVCDDGSLELGIEKIAIYVHADTGPTHAALQLPDGKWTSKLGAWEDVEHESEHDLAGQLPGCYGQVHAYMQRRRIQPV